MEAASSGRQLWTVSEKSTTPIWKFLEGTFFEKISILVNLRWIHEPDRFSLKILKINKLLTKLVDIMGGNPEFRNVVLVANFSIFRNLQSKTYEKQNFANFYEENMHQKTFKRFYTKKIFKTLLNLNNLVLWYWFCPSPPFRALYIITKAQWGRNIKFCGALEC